MENSYGSTPDSITDLPDNVIENILMFMSIRDAARTSVLSKKWQFKWVKLPQLVFDDKLCREMKLTSPKLILTLYRVLLSHRGPISNFTLSVSELEINLEIDYLVRYILSNPVREFTFQTWIGEPYKLPFSLYSCSQITRLNLRSCLFTPPSSFKGLSRLASLELRDVAITSDVFATLISGSPVLERVKCSSIVALGHLEVVAPNLKFLDFKGHLKSICFKNAPNLSTISIRSKACESEFHGGETFDWVKLFGRLPGLENLHMSYDYAEFLAAGVLIEWRPTTLTHLKVLKLSMISLEDEDEVRSTLCLMIHSPHLQKVTIEAFWDDGDDFGASVPKVVEMVWKSTFCFPRLQEVKMQLVSGTRSQLEFIKLLLARSMMLETMVVEPDPDIIAGEGFRILKELVQFQRLSPTARIIYNYDLSKD